MHSALFGNKRFAFYPLLILGLAFCTSLSIIAFQPSFSLLSILLFVHVLFFFFGASIGSFGTLGREFMNRRFGQASLLAYSSRNLPLSDRTIFSVFVVKDICYYFAFWIIPCILGFSLAMPIIGIPLTFAPVYLLTLSLSFLIGMSLVFFLSMIYARFGKWAATALFVLLLIAVVFNQKSVSGYPPWDFSITGNLNDIWISLGSILLFSVLALIFVSFDFPTKKEAYENSLKRTSKRFSFAKSYALFWAKDYIDIRRSDGGVGKVLFSFLIPLLFIWFLLPFLTVQLRVNFLVIFGIFLGVLSSSIYTQLTRYDLFNQYLFLPIKTSTVLKSKVLGYAVLNLLSAAILVIAALVNSQTAFLLPAFVQFVLMSFFALSVTILYTGLSPSLMLMDVQTLLKYIFTIIPVILILVFIYALGPVIFTLGSVGIVLVSIILLKRAFVKWDFAPHQTF